MNASCGKAEPLLAGYFGFANVGDELILNAFRSVYGGRCHVASGPLRSPLAIFFQLLKSPYSCLVFPGGEVFQDRTGWKSLLFYAAQAVAARLARRPIFLLFQGWPDDLSTFGKWLLLPIFLSARFVSLRDRHTRPSGLEETPIRFSADICFLLTPPPQHRTPERKILCVLREPRTRSDAKRWDRLLEMMAERFIRDEIVVTAFHPGDELFCRHAARRLGAKFIAIPRTDSAAALRLVASSRFVLCGRYHAAVLAVLCGRRSFGLDEDGRIAALSAYAGSPPFITLRSALSNPKKFSTALAAALRTRIPDCAERLRTGVEEVFRRAQKTFPGAA